MRVLNFLRRHLQYFIAAYDRWSRDEGPVMAAAVAYYVALSFFPLVLVLISGLGLFFRFAHSGQSAHQAVLTLVESDLSPSARVAVEQALEQVRDRSTVHGPIALAMMLFSAIAGFVQLQQAFDRIGHVPRSASKGMVNAVRMVLFERLIAFLMLCGLALLVTAVFIGTMVLFAMEQYTTGILPGSQMFWRPLQSLVSFLTNTILFSLIYRSLPKSPAPFKYCLRGGLLAALIWEIGRQILAALLIGTRYTAAYGVIGSFIGLMLWCYYAVAVLLLGAEYIEVRWHATPGSQNDRAPSSTNESEPPASDDEGGDSPPPTPHHHLRTVAHFLAHPFPDLMR
ncbi:MAG TPA: YihY/virulence factor BrkB family protein [Planctomycetaceae bacterium]|jgi:membrane protein|nr:YihY/virulence factor BrkB family protein [Planctomycetaceae bacterium]